MNKIYKLKFDKRRNELVVVSEITAGMGKEKSTGDIAGLSGVSPFVRLLGKLTPLSLFTGLITGLLPMMVMAADLPTGGQIVAGQGSISTSGSQMTVHQQTQNMAANWQSFDIGNNNSVQFVQPDSSSVALNRVTGGSASQIMGSLTANGKVFLINPNGVLFGQGARVDTGGFVVSTKNMNTADFMQGNYTLSGGSVSGAEIVNQGALTTSKGGFIVLAADRVRNSGTITTPSGKAVLAAADSLTLKLDNGGLTSVSVNGSVVNALVENSGLVSATNGQVYLTAKGQNMLLNTVVNNSGTLEAKGLSAEGGVIRLDGGDSGVVSQSGMLLADSDTGRGGKITVEGQNIHLAAGSKTSATGKTGGGSVHVGGGWQGQDAGIRNAAKVVMDKNAVIDVSATHSGNGGAAVLWSDDYTSFRGTILAKGGALSGNGGQVETSSHDNLQAFGDVDASAVNGRGGSWLLDPTDVTIVDSTAGGDSGVTNSTTNGVDIFSPTADGAQILNSSIESQLNKGTIVTVTTSGADTEGQSGNITVNADIQKTAGGGAGLTLNADNNITVATGINIGSTFGSLDLNLLAGNTSPNALITLGNNINISLNGGNFYAGSANGVSSVGLTFSNSGKIEAEDILMNLTGGLSGYAYGLMADNNLTINGGVTGTTGNGNELRLTAGNLLNINSPGTINLQAASTTNGSGSVILEGTNGVSLNADGDITLSAANATTNAVTVNSSNGDISLLSGGNITLQKATVTSGVRRNINVLGAGSTTARTQILNSTLSSNGGDITVDQLNQSTTDSSGNVVTNGNAMTLRIDGSVLNASQNATRAGNITLKAYNPNICLTTAALTNTVRNGGAMLQVSGNSALTGNNILLETTLTGRNALYLPVFLNDVNISALRNITLRGIAREGAAPVQTELRGAGNSLTAAQGDITIEAPNSIFLNGTTAGNSILTAGGDILLNAGTGVNASKVQLTAGGGVNIFAGNGVLALDGNISAADDITLNASGAANLTNTALSSTNGAVSVAANGGALTLTNGNISATDNIDLRADNGGILVGSGGSLVSVGGNITLTGNSGSSADGIRLNGTENNKVNISAVGGTVTLNGASVGGAGVFVTNTLFDALRAAIHGSSAQGSYGFSLTDTTLGSNLDSLENVTLSSAGSGAVAVNVLDNSIVNDGNRNNLLMKTIENMTTVDMNGTAIFNSSLASWNQHYSTDSNPNGGWIFNNTTVDASSADLTGVSFTNSTLTMHNGNLSVANNGSLTLSQSNVTVNSGSVSLSSAAGDMDLSGSRLTVT
ncbi:TPA: filamentous hemagglutinin N-terminal domain-containing protein, partial [Escherichia coli]|nr:filamentous hemagglutinin N-terminal domain-containing protein [Escherichia coli]